MKKINILIVLGLFVLLIGAAQPAQAALMGTWVPSVAAVRSSETLTRPGDSIIRDIAQLNAAASKFEGLLNAYSASRPSEFMPWADDYWPLPKNLFSSARNLSNSLEEFNTALMEVYPTLSEDEQLAVRNAYSSLVSYLEDLAKETNSVFGREVFQIIEYDDPLPKGGFIILYKDHTEYWT